MNKKTSQWLIRSSKGKIQGPFSTREIMLNIKGGSFDGTEKISKYPGGSWVPISHNSEFYDFLLTNLSKVDSLDDDETNWDIDLETTKSNNLEPHIKKNKKIPELPKDKPKIIDDKKEQRKKFISNKNNKQEINKKVKKTIVDKSDEYDFSKVKKKVNKKKNNLGETKKTKTKRNRAPKTKKKSNFLRKIIILFLGFIGMFLFLDNKKNDVANKVVFLKPNKTISLSPELVKKEADKGVKVFLTDTFSGYINAQKSFVKVLEADPSYEDLYSLLCVSQYNLWSYSNDNVSNLKVLIKIVDMAKRYDSSGLNYQNCNNIYLTLSGDLIKAEKNIDNLIKKFGNSNYPPTISYFLKSEILVARQKFNESLEYITMLEELWPDWLATQYLSAVTYFNLNQKDESISRFKQIIKKHPKNKKALIYVGAMRNVFFQQYEKSINEILKSLKMKERVSQKVVAIANYYLADSYLRLNKSEVAMPYIQKSYKLDPLNKKIENLYINYNGGLEDADLSDASYIAQGDQFYHQEDYNAAQAYYKEAIKVNPKNIIAALKAADSLWKLRLSADAIKLLEKSLELNLKSVRVAVKLSSYLSRQYQFDKAFEVLNKTHKAVRGHYKIYGSFANLELDQGNYIKAIKYADKAMSKYGEDIDSFIVKGKAQLIIGQHKEAYALMSKALDIEPNNTELIKIFVQSYYKVHGIESTIRHINKLIKENPTEKDYRWLLGDIYYSDDQYDSAIQIFKQLIDIDKNYMPAHLGLAKSYKKEGKLNESKKAYFQAAQIDPLNSKPILEVGLLYLETKKYGKAEKQFRRIINVNPNFPKINFYFSKLYFLKGNYSEAIKWVNKEKVKNPSQVDSYLLAGEIYEKQGSYQFCSREYQQAMKFREFGAVIYIKISRCYRKSGALDVAINMLEKARKINSTVPDIYRELGAVYELRSENEKARWAYENYLSLAPNAIDRGQVQQKIQSL